jgi:regulator of protease activity HflC (stomatin/prohibitin superfamily)
LIILPDVALTIAGQFRSLVSTGTLDHMIASNSITLAIVLVLVGLGVLAILGGIIALGAVLIAFAIAIFAALKMAQQWQRAIILRAGRFYAVKGPGLFAIVPILDTVAAVIDTRIRTTQFVAEQTLTRDTVPVDVDAIIFWVVVDPRHAALEVVNYAEAIGWAAQTSLREMIGASELAMLLSNRKAMDADLRATIAAKTAQWGIDVRSVEIRDVRIPVALQDAMSRQAQAERERQARVILGAAEAEIANKFAEAARTYADNPVALHLRGMNMLYESVKERGSTIIVPSSAIDSMNLGGIAGVTALAQGQKNAAPAEGSAAAARSSGPWPRTSPPTS